MPILEGRLQISGEDRDPLRLRVDAPHEQVVRVGARSQVVERGDDVGDPEAVGIGEGTGPEYVAFDRHLIVEDRADRADAQQVARLQYDPAALRTLEVEALHAPVLALDDALERGVAQVRIGCRATRDR